MEFTGERMMEEINDGGMYAEHMVRYQFASQFVKNKSILDLACGSGYGSVFLKKMGATHVKGIDSSVETVSYCNAKYNDVGVDFVVGNVNNITSDDNSVEVIVSMETLEHVDSETQHKFLGEVSRVLKDDGVFIVSTPNIAVTPGNNPFHLKELTYLEFSELLNKYFSNVKIFFQDNVEASFITSDDFLKKDVENVCTDFNVINSGKLASENCLYFIAVCGKKDVLFDEKYVVLSDSRPWKKEIECINEALNNNDVNLQLLQSLNKIKSMENSVFWKLRSKYIKVKGFFK